MTISYTPAYPIPDEEVALSMSAGNGTRVDWEITSVPPTSAVELGKRFDVAGDPTDVFTPDVPGEYGIKAYDIRETGIAPPRFRDDPIGNPGTIVLGTQTGTIYVAAVMSLPITTAVGHGVRLEVRIVNATVRQAELLDALTEVSRTAALDSTVAASLAALVGVAVSSLGNDFVTGVADMHAKFEAHRVLTAGSVHANADSVSAMQSYAPNSVDYALLVLNELYDKLVRSHMQTGTSITPRWHSDSDDGKNVPLAGKATTLAQGTVLFADLAYRVYERHRAQTLNPPVHGAVDATNVVVAAAPLSALIRDYFDAIAAVSPSAISGENQGANQAAHRYGFVV